MTQVNRRKKEVKNDVWSSGSSEESISLVSDYEDVVFERRAFFLYMLLKPQRNSPVNSVSQYVRGGHLTGVTEVACWLLIHDSSFSISWECKQPLGDRFNHVFIFSNSHSLEGLFSVSPALKPQHYISLHTQYFFFSVGPSRVRPPRLSVTFRVFQKTLVFVLCAETKSPHSKVWLGDQKQSCMIWFIEGSWLKSVRVWKKLKKYI